MISNKLVRELRRNLAQHKYEITDDGRLFFAQAKGFVGGVFEHSLNNGPWVVDPNLLPTQGLNSMLDIALGAVTKQTAWYIAPFATNTAPVSTLTAANFASTQTEFTNYAEGVRQVWTPVAAAGGVTTNAAAPAQITIGSGGQTAIYGLGLISASALSSTAGVLQACTLFSAPRTGLLLNDILGLRYSITLTSS